MNDMKNTQVLSGVFNSQSMLKLVTEQGCLEWEKGLKGPWYRKGEGVQPVLAAEGTRSGYDGLAT
jgi:hypothetical protein